MWNLSFFIFTKHFFIDWMNSPSVQMQKSGIKLKGFNCLLIERTDKRGILFCFFFHVESLFLPFQSTRTGWTVWITRDGRTSHNSRTLLVDANELSISDIIKAGLWGHQCGTQKSQQQTNPPIALDQASFRGFFPSPSFLLSSSPLQSAFFIYYSYFWRKKQTTRKEKKQPPKRSKLWWDQLWWPFKDRSFTGARCALMCVCSPQTLMDARFHGFSVVPRLHDGNKSPSNTNCHYR